MNGIRRIRGSAGLTTVPKMDLELEEGACTKMRSAACTHACMHVNGRVGVESRGSEEPKSLTLIPKNLVPKTPTAVSASSGGMVVGPARQV